MTNEWLELANRDYYRVREVARALEIHENTVRNMCNDGRLECWTLPVSGYRRIPKIAVERLMQEKVAMSQPTLSIELVPRTCWWSNVRSHVTRAQWETCKTYAKAKTGAVCIICGGAGKRYPVDAHEIWSYDEDSGVQTLVDIVPLCPPCHQVKHLGRTKMMSTPYQWAQVIEHFQRVNDWPDWKVERYITLAFEIWEIRSQLEWTLDISFLDRLGVVPAKIEPEPSGELRTS